MVVFSQFPADLSVKYVHQYHFLLAMIMHYYMFIVINLIKSLPV